MDMMYHMTAGISDMQAFIILIIAVIAGFIMCSTLYSGKGDRCMKPDHDERILKIERNMKPLYDKEGFL